MGAQPPAQRDPVHREANPDRVVVGRAGLPPPHGLGGHSPGTVEPLQRADDSHGVVVVQAPGHRGGLTVEPGPEARAPQPCGLRFEGAAQLEIGRRRGIETSQERANVKPGAPDHDRQTASPRDLVDESGGIGPEAGGVIPLIGIHHVHEVMRHSQPFLRRGLSRRDIHTAVDLARVGTDDLQWNAPGQGDRHGCLADPGGTRDHEERTLHRVRLNSTRLGGPPAGRRRARGGSWLAGRADRSTGSWSRPARRRAAPFPGAPAPPAP
jgi:hypothetical protein